MTLHQAESLIEELIKTIEIRTTHELNHIKYEEGLDHITTDQLVDIVKEAARDL